MPNMLDDGLLPQASVSYWFSRNQNNVDFLLQSAVAYAINAACATGAFTCTVVAAAYAQVNREAMIQRLVNMGFTASISGTTITVTWSNVC